MRRRRYVYTIQPHDVGATMLHLDGKPTYVADFLGRVQVRDIGKRIYESAGVYQVESDAQRDARMGAKRNPSVVVYGNPDPLSLHSAGPLRARRKHHPLVRDVVGVIAANLHAIRYEHADDGDYYEHEFEPGAVAVALRDGTVLLYRPDGKSVWEEFA